MTDFWKKLEKPILIPAPMAGITDSAFRQICRKYGADVTYSEMACASALFFKPQKTLELVRSAASERPYVVQLFGKNPEHFAVATKIISEKIKPDGIDINFGCPAKKVFGNGSGCALMPQIELAREIIQAVLNNTKLPVSLKIRAGVRNFNALEFIENTKNLPYSAVMVHGRTYEGKFSSPVDWDIIAKIKELIPNKIVLGNGGIQTPEDILSLHEKYPNLDGFGIARGILGKPYLFKQTKELLKNKSYNEYDFPKVRKIILKHAELIWKDKQNLGMLEIRKHLVWYIKGFPGASEMRQKLVRAESVDEIKEILAQ